MQFQVSSRMNSVKKKSKDTVIMEVLVRLIRTGVNPLAKDTGGMYTMLLSDIHPIFCLLYSHATADICLFLYSAATHSQVKSLCGLLCSCVLKDNELVQLTKDKPHSIVYHFIVTKCLRLLVVNVYLYSRDV